MIALSLARIAEIVGGTLTDVSPADADTTMVTGSVEFDSRKVGPGGLFLALPGARADGHDHAAAAAAAGAVGVLSARPVGVPAIVVAPRADSTSRSGVLEHDADGSGAAVLAALARLATAVADDLVERGLTIVGVTGSSGKTSTKDLLAAVLKPLGTVVAPPGSFNNELGHPWTVLRADADTDYLVLELSARHRGNIAALAAIAPPQVGVVLNVGTAHLGEFGSREAIAETKAELVQAVGESGVVILNADDPAVAAMADRTVARVVRVSRHSRTGAGPADVWAGPVSLDDAARARFTLHAGRSSADVRLAVSGEHQVANSLCAAAVALECGGTVEQVAEALAAAEPVSAHRMAVIDRADGVTLIDDAYNANPDSMRAALRALASMARGGSHGEGEEVDGGTSRRRSWAVLGEMGELGSGADETDAITEHDRIGRLAVRLDISHLVVVGAGRAMRAMHHGAVMEGSWGAEATAVPNPDAALALLRAELRPGDIVLVKASNAAGLIRLADELAADGGGPAR